MSTKKRDVAEQMKRGKVENIAMDGVNIRTFGKSDNSEIVEDRRNLEGEQMCKLIVNGSARHCESWSRSSSPSQCTQSFR